VLRPWDGAYVNQFFYIMRFEKMDSMRFEKMDSQFFSRIGISYVICPRLEPK
jgi:hypothetical protein